MQWLFLLLASLFNIAGILVLKRSSSVGPRDFDARFVLDVGRRNRPFCRELDILCQGVAGHTCRSRLSYLDRSHRSGREPGGAFFFGERVTPLQLLGTALVVGGIFVLSLQRGPG